MKKLKGLILMAIMALSMSAQVPQSINYQGALRDLDGNIMASQDITLRFTLSALNDIKYSETHVLTTTSLGMFNVAIGDGNAVFGSMQNIIWSNGNVELRTEVFDSETGQYVDLGRVPFRSVPYALYADSETLWSEEGNNIFFNQGGVGIGTSTVNLPFEVHTGGSTLTFSNTYNANPILSINHPTNGSRGDMVVNSHINSSPTLQLGFAATEGTSRSVNFRMAGQDYMTILGNGNVGIGVTNPLHPFHVVNQNSSFFFWHTPNGNPEIRVANPAGANGALTFINAIDNQPTIQIGYPAAEGTSRNVNFRMAGKDHMTIRGTGHIGINNENPSSRLHITNGDMQVTNGDVFIDDLNHGVIMKSPDGQCWRMTVDNSGQPVFQSVGCPN